MGQKVIELTCPGCGARIANRQEICEWCHKPVIVSSFNSMDSLSPIEINKYAASYRKALAENPDDSDLNISAGMCYMKLKQYDKAFEAFEKAMEDNFDNSEMYFYAAISLLKGKQPFATPKANVDKAMDYIRSATMLENRGIYYFVLAYLAYDYYSRKMLNTRPGYKEYLQNAVQYGVTSNDIQCAFELMGCEVPAALLG